MPYALMVGRLDVPLMGAKILVPKAFDAGFEAGTVRSSKRAEALRLRPMLVVLNEDIGLMKIIYDLYVLDSSDDVSYVNAFLEL